MKNVLIFAGLAGLAAAIAIYFVGEANSNAIDDYYESEYVTDADLENYDLMENTGRAQTV
jgi:hypothetical protein